LLIVWSDAELGYTYPTKIHVRSKVRSQVHRNHIGCISRRDSLEDTPKRYVSKERETTLKVYHLPRYTAEYLADQKNMDIRRKEGDEDKA